MSTHPWLIDELDLAAYLARVGLAAKAPTRAALDELHEAHVRTFTFDNIDVLLRQHPGVALAAVQEKFVGRGRGGYCFEHSTLFAAVLERLGYDIERRLGRVGDPSSSPRTHMVVVVTLDGQRLLADPGFGMSLLRPIPLEDGAEDDYQGWQYRVRRVTGGTGNGEKVKGANVNGGNVNGGNVNGGNGIAADPSWELHRLREAGWELMHATDDLAVRPVDVAMGHHFTSTYPGSHFTQGLMLTRHEPGQHTTVAGGALTVRRAGAPTEHRELARGELSELLHSLEVPLTQPEEARLLDVLADLER